MSSTPEITLTRGLYSLRLEPHTGGSIQSLTYAGQDIFRLRPAAGVLDCASFPLVPFCNRIAGSAFDFDGLHVKLSSNHPTEPDEPALHGFGWLAPWRVDGWAESSVALVCEHMGDEWPWHYVARQCFALDDNGLLIDLSIANLSDRVMPVGLGFHPFFPRDGMTVMKSLHRGERRADGSSDLRSNGRDWWGERAVGQRIVDTTYIARRGDITVEWPERKIAVMLSASPDLPFTHVYVPAGEDFFCAEPVSHLPEAFASQNPVEGWRTLGPGEEWSVWMRITAYPLPAP